MTPGGIPLTEKLLLAAGGWREMKEARALHKAGRASEASYADGVLTGLVNDQGKTLRAGLKVRSASDMDNLCTCMKARREGILCAHSLAVGLEWLSPQPAPRSPSALADPTPPCAGPWPAWSDDPAAAATPAECHVVLPPRFAAAWERGKIVVGFEVAMDENRVLLSALDRSANLFVGPDDALLLATLKRISPGAVPGVIQLGRDDILRLLEGLADHPRVTFGKCGHALVRAEPFRPEVSMRGMRLHVRWPQEQTPLIAGEMAWVYRHPDFQPVAPGMPDDHAAIFTDGLVLAAEVARSAVEELSRYFDVPDDVGEQLPRQADPRVRLHIEGSLNHLDATLRFAYGEKTIPASDAAAPVVITDSLHPGRMLVGNRAVEDAAIGTLRRWGFRGPAGHGAFVLNDRARILRFFAHGFQHLNQEWEITTGPRFSHAADQVEPVVPTFDLQSSGEDWFSLEVEYTTGAGTLPREEIQRLLMTGQNHKRLPNGKIAVLDTSGVDEIQQALADCDPAQPQPGTFRIDRIHAGYLAGTIDAVGGRVSGPPPAGAAAPTFPPGVLGGVLRPYQLEGVRWLLGLAANRMGGILADDMGLGKTLQALAAIEVLGGPALVVCPTSLVGNWVAEAAKFSPHLNVAAFDGADRKARLTELAAADLVVTSYALLRLDADVLGGREWRIIVADEAQHIKNPDTQAAKALCAIPARHHIALTGTPIENSARDVWSIMQFACPGYLGSRNDFAGRFVKPLEQPGGDSVRQRLARRLAPVVLRRLKHEVAPELPARIEQVIHCDLTSRQRAVYDAVLRESRSTILDAEGGRRRMLALTALLRLRQASCDLRLLKLPDVNPDEASAKLDAARELIGEAADGGHRVLVFSQFVGMLQILVPMLQEMGLAFCYLDGQTRDRNGVVARFQRDAGIPVFLVSLKAGGVGLNLTGADTVILFDPWWNPAVEAQATDRAHRIGQHRIVTAYKLIARGTVEEKILRLQEKKRETSHGLLGGGMSGLSDTDLAELLE